MCRKRKCGLSVIPLCAGEWKKAHLHGWSMKKTGRQYMKDYYEGRDVRMNNRMEVIGIDHGWSMMKTASQVFVTGIKEITTTPALFADTFQVLLEVVTTVPRA